MVHNGHRERLRNRFLDSPDSFEDHELLELLLFYSIPRANTNEIAHDLLNTFGSVKGVLNAGVPALTQIDNMGEKSAIFLRVVSELLQRYRLDDLVGVNILESSEILKEYLCSLFVGTDNEKAFILLFNNARKLISCKKLSEGYCAANIITMRDISLASINTNAAYAIMAHNHPNGKAIPSGEDISTTAIVKTALKTNGITLLEHFVVADSNCTAIMNTSPAMIYIQKH